MYDLIIIGGGVAGYSAAMYAKRFGMNILVLSEVDGGTLTQTHLVENWPGIPSISGFDLGNAVAEHAKSIGAESRFGTVVSLKKEENMFYLQLEDGVELQAKSVLLATGTKHREMGLPSEQKLRNRGVSYCATCDGAFFKDKIVAMIGGSDSAVKESLLLAQYAKHVYIIYRGDTVRPEPINRKRMEENPKIEVINNANVVEVLGETRVEGVRLDTGKTLELQGVFIEIGRIPYSNLAQQIGVHLNEKNEVIINKYAETNIPGFFAAGDVTDSHFKQAIVAAAEGAHAASSAFDYIKSSVPA